jgi:Heterokaryon incompatibility protein (HET)
VSCTWVLSILISLEISSTIDVALGIQALIENRRKQLSPCTLWRCSGAIQMFKPFIDLKDKVPLLWDRPKQWMLEFIDEGKPKATSLTLEELERSTAWAKLLVSPGPGAEADYTYQPLGSTSTLSTRLVKLLPADDRDDIQLVIECVELGNCASYEALSYCWGDPSVKTTIWCDGGSLHVTKNLKSALLHLRNRTKERLLWIDAVCINQDDLQERSQQVGIMRDIYKNASETLVWLGEESQNSGLGIELCERLYDFFKDERKDLKAPGNRFNSKKPSLSNHQDPFNPSYAQTDEGDSFKRSKRSIKEGEERDDGNEVEDTTSKLPLRINPPNVYELLALRDLASRQWFRRTWITQELALASKVTMVCGHRSISWDTFIFGFTMTFINGKSTSGGWDEDENFIGALVHIRESIHRSESVNYRDPLTLLDLLHACRIFGATDPRDKVYGLLGIAPPDSEVTSVQVNYSKSVGEVYEDLARLILSSSSNLDLLSIPQSNSQFSQRQPSWVPDWSHKASSRLDLVVTAGQKTFASGQIRKPAASRQTRSIAAFKDPHTLVISGYVADSIAQLSEIIQPPTVDKLQMQQLGQKLDDMESVVEAEGLASMSVYFDVMMSIEDLALCGSQDSIYSTGELCTRALWRTLCTDVSTDQLESAELAFTSWRQAMNAPRMLKKYRVDKFRGMYNYLAAVGYGVTDILYDGDGLFVSLMRPAFYSRFAVTKLGYFALVPPMAKVGDQVGIFKGGKVPLIFRSEDNQWRLVGESYVHGIMQGEIFDETKCREMELI